MTQMLPIPVGAPITNPGSGPTAIQTRTMVVQWALAAGVPAPDYFQVIAYTGSDPTNTAVYLWNPAVKLTPAAAAKMATTLGTTQPYAAKIQYSCAATLGPVTASVCSEYVSGQVQSQAPVRTRPISPFPGGSA